MPPSIDVLTSSSAPAWPTALMALKIPVQALAFGMKQQCPWGCMEPRDRERQTASHDPRPKQPRLAPEGTRHALCNERPQPPGRVGRVSRDRRKARKSLAHSSRGMPPPLTRRPCSARTAVGLAHRGTGRDRFSWHRQCIMAVIALQMPGKLISSDLASENRAGRVIVRIPHINPAGGVDLAAILNRAPVPVVIRNRDVVPLDPHADRAAG